MKKIFLALRHRLNRYEEEYDWAGTSLGAVALTIMLSQQLWGVSPKISHGSFFILIIQNFTFDLFGLLAVFCYEGLYLIKLLRRYDRSTWWILPLMFFLVGVSFPPSWNWSKVNGLFMIAFIVIHYPLFWNRAIHKNREPTIHD